MFHMMINAFWEELEVRGPIYPGAFRQRMDALDRYIPGSPDDICSWDEAAAVREMNALFSRDHWVLRHD